VLSITGDPAETAARFARDLNLRSSIIVDPEGKTSQGYGVSVLPTTFVIDKRGIVRDVALGFDSKQEAKLDQLVRDLLAEPNVTDASAAAGDGGIAGASVSDAGAPKRDAGK